MEVEQQRQKDAAEGHKIALKLEGKINRKVSRYMNNTIDCRTHFHCLCEFVPILTAGGEADSDDCGVWCYLGRRTLTDSCKLEYMSYSGT